MNVFVLNTGRCGLTTFIKACRHITNFTCAHESRTGGLGEDRFAYPENHIESDNRLSWLLGRLDQAYGDKAIYVHLTRNEHDAARSYAERYMRGIIKAYGRSGILKELPKTSDALAVALDYCRTANSNIELFLKDKTKKINIRLEDIDADFTAFWNRIGAEGDIRAALAEFDTHHNAGTRPPMSWKQNTIPRILRTLTRLMVYLPSYIKNA